MDKVICVKSVEVKPPRKEGEKSGWIVLTDETGKAHNVFRSKLKKGDFDSLENSKDKSLKMTKEQVPGKDGTMYWDVVGVEPVEGIFQQEAAKEMKSKGGNASFALSYVKDLIVADKLPLEKWYFQAELFRRYLDGELPEDMAMDAKILTYMAWITKEEVKEK